VGLQKQPRYMLERINVIPKLIPYEQTCMGFSECVHSLKESMQEHTGIQA
jgi:SulP family sulfate permease